MGCRMSTEVWQVAGWNVLEERKKGGRQGQSVGHGMDTGESGPMRERNIDVSQTVSDRKMEKQSLRTSKQRAEKWREIRVHRSSPECCCSCSLILTTVGFMQVT